MCSSSCPQKSGISSCQWIYEGIFTTLADHAGRGSVAPRRKGLPGRKLYFQQRLLGQSKMNLDGIFNGQHVRLG
jgi:hypothetical protein